jgi:twinkle protein
MAVTQNLPCPKCQENGHDREGNHLMVFEDGAMYCNRSHHHKTGEPYYREKGKKHPIFEHDINGKIKYTEEQYRELESTGKLKDPKVRALALGGMREEVRYSVLDELEQLALEQQWERELSHFRTLKIKNLVSRGIRGEIAKLYGVRVGLNDKGRVARHYYPVYDEHMELCGSQCRNLPKDFRSGQLGKLWGKTKLFGQDTVSAVCASGARKDILLIVGGQCDAMAAQQMLIESRKNTKWEGHLFHVWSPHKGEAGIEELANNLKQIQKFKKVIFAFDADEVGQEFNRKAVNLVRDRAYILTYPDGCKDANQCLLEDRADEFVDAWWNSTQPSFSSIKSLDDHDLWERATKKVEMGMSWPWPTMTEHTFGIRPHNMYTIGGGSGVGKTEVAKEIIQYLMDFHNREVGVIFMEEPADMTAKVLAGKWINKKIHLPVNHHPKGHPQWDEGRDYTEKQAIKALDVLRAKKRLQIAECRGDTSINNIMAMCEQFVAMGIREIFIDNLTTISHDGKEGSVKAIDESMMRLGTFMQENPVSIFLLSHLSKPQDPRKPHEEGGAVRMSDFRGAMSISFWSTFMVGVERNTQADNLAERCTTYLRCVKDRLTGIATGEVVILQGNTKTGRLLEGATQRGYMDNAGHSKVKKGKKGKKDKKKLEETGAY